MSSGKVYLVGAGPGDPGLLTVRGRDVLASAEVLVYDRLVSPEIVALAPPSADGVYVGKRPGHHTLRQPEINALLVERARAGQQVVRLKGGDPFVFGRGGEEAEALAAAGVLFEVVPGISAALAVAAYAGIPVTHRAVASSFAVVTGQEGEARGSQALAYDRLAGAADTLVFLMGVERLPAIVDALLAGGRDPATPVAVIAAGTLPEQRTLVATLADVVAQVAAAGLQPPAVTVVGDVVALRERLRWFDRRPLFGRRVLVTRTREQASILVELLRAAGARPVELPTIAIRPPADYAALDRALLELPNPPAQRRLPYSASHPAKEGGGRGPLCPQPPLPHREKGGAGYAGDDAGLRSIGPSRNRELSVPPFLPVGERGHPVPPSFAGKGARGLGHPGPPSLHGSQVREVGAWVIFTSANGVAAVFGRLEALGRDARAFGGVGLAAIGPATAEALGRHGLRADYAPAEALTSAILADFRERDLRGVRVLLPRADIAPPDLGDGLAALGADVQSVVAYRTVPAEGLGAEARRVLVAGEVDTACFTSSSTVRNLVEALDGEVALLAPLTVACIGPVTAATARELGLRVDVVAREHTVPGLVAALCDAAPTAG